MYNISDLSTWNLQNIPSSVADTHLENKFCDVDEIIDVERANNEIKNRQRFKNSNRAFVNFCKGKTYEICDQLKETLVYKPSV